MPSCLVSRLWPVLTALCQRGESWAFARILSTSLSFSPSASSHHAETEEQVAGPSCCDGLAGVTVSAGKERSAGRVDDVPFLCYSLVGALQRFWLMVGCLANILWPVGHLICVPGGSSSSLVWFQGDSYYPNFLSFLVHLCLVCLAELCEAWGMSRVLCSSKCVFLWNSSWREDSEVFLRFSSHSCYAAWIECLCRF